MNNTIVINTPINNNNNHLDPGHSLLRLHHPCALGGLALAHQLRGAQVLGPEQNSLDQNCRYQESYILRIKMQSIKVDLY